MRLVVRDQEKCSKCWTRANALFLVGDYVFPAELCAMCAAEFDLDAVSEAISDRMQELADALECLGDHDLIRELERRSTG